MKILFIQFWLINLPISMLIFASLVSCSSSLSRWEIETADYALSLPNFCDFNSVYLSSIESRAWFYGKTLEDSGWYGKWDTIYSQLCTHYLIWGEYEKAKEHGREHFFRRRANDYIGADYFIAEFLTSEPDTFASRFAQEAEFRDDLIAFTWEEEVIRRNVTMGFETIEDPKFFSKWLELGDVFEIMWILAARLLKGEENDESEAAIVSLLSNFTTQSEDCREFLNLLSNNAGLRLIREWMISSILFERYARAAGREELVERIRNFRDSLIETNNLADRMGCLASNPDQIKAIQNHSMDTTPVSAPH